MNSYIVFTFLAFLSYSMWGFINSSISQQNINLYSGLFYSSLGYFIISAFFLLIKGQQLNFSFNAMINGTILGVVTGIGGLFVLIAMTKLQNNASVIILVTSMYPLGTLILNSIFLNESIAVKKFLGFITVIIGMTMVSI